MEKSSPKIIFNIIASSDYTDFKDIWIDNIFYFQEHFPEYSKFIDFYFTYSTKTETENLNDTFRLQSHQLHQNKSIQYFDFYYLSSGKYERKRGIFKRNLAFLKFLKLQNTKGFPEANYIIRTNLSTLFNFNLFIDWIKNLPKNNLLAATMSDTYMEEFSIFSGTNFLISYDLINVLLASEENMETHFNKLQIEYPEDDLLMGQILIQNVIDLNIITINRCDYIECKYTIQGIENYIPPSIIFEKCHYLDPVFCFRFKTINRNLDRQNMKYILENHIKNNISLETCVHYFKNKINSLQLVLNQPDLYKEFGQKPFKIYEKVLLPSQQKEDMPFFSNLKVMNEPFFWIKNEIEGEISLKLI